MHIGKLMARLNPANVRFDVGSGGVPELTNADIAAALGMVQDGIGRELLCSVWWPDGSRLSPRPVGTMLEDLQRREWMRREQDMLHAMLAVAEHRGGESLRLAQGKYAAAHAKRWPRWIDNPELGTHSEGYERVRVAVLLEVGRAHLCQICQGRGFIWEVDAVHRACAACNGTGHRAVSDRWRAGAIGITEGGYRHTWGKVYEWTLTLCTDAMQDASRAMARAVGYLPEGA